MICFALQVALLVATIGAARANIYFNQIEPHTWTTLLATANDSQADRVLYDDAFAVSNINNILMLPTGATVGVRLEAARTTIDLAEVEPLVCRTRRVEVFYRVQHRTDYEAVNAGQLHKIVFGSAADATSRWPRGLAFSFAGGGVPHEFALPERLHPHPTAFVFEYGGRNVCSSAFQQNCTVFERTDLPRFGAGYFIVRASFDIDRASALAHANGFRVDQQITEGMDTRFERIFDLKKTDLASVPSMDASDWLPRRAAIGVSGPHVTIVAHQSLLAVGALGITSTDLCDPTTTTSAPTTSAPTSTSTESSSTTTLSSSASVPSTTRKPTRSSTSNSKDASSSSSSSTTSNQPTSSTTIETTVVSETERASNSQTSVLESEQSSEGAKSREELPEQDSDWLVVAMACVGTGVLLLFLCFCLYVCRKRIRKTSAFVQLYKHTPCRTLFCFCCANAMEPLLDFELDDLPTPRSVMTTGAPTYDQVPAPRSMYYIPGRGAVPRDSSHAYDQVDDRLMGFDTPDHIPEPEGNSVYGQLSFVAANGTRTALGGSGRRRKPIKSNRGRSVAYDERFPTVPQGGYEVESISGCSTDYGAGNSDDGDDAEESGYSAVGAQALNDYDKVRKKDYALTTDKLV